MGVKHRRYCGLELFWRMQLDWKKVEEDNNFKSIDNFMNKWNNFWIEENAPNLSQQNKTQKYLRDEDNSITDCGIKPADTIHKESVINHIRPRGKSSLPKEHN